MYAYGRPKARFDRETWMRVKDKQALRRARARQGYTQYDLAALTRCTQATISALETGGMPRCSDDLARTLAKWLKLDVEDLFVEHPGSRVQRVTNAAGSTRQAVA